MGSQNSQPDPDPDETRDESSESDVTEGTPESQSGGLPLSRRATLASLVGIGGLGLASGTATAKKGKTWKKDRDADGNDLLNLGALTMADNPTEITDFTGANLGVANGKLSAAQWNKDVDAGGNDLTNLGSASASIVNADTLSDNGSGTINLGALVDADKNELKQLGAVAMQQNKEKIVDFAGNNLSIDSNNVLNAQVSSPGASVFLNSSQTIPTGTRTTVVYNDKVADDRNEYDTTTGKFTCMTDGDYHASTTVSWSGGLPPDTNHSVSIRVNEANKASISDDVAETSTSFVQEHISKTLRDLSGGDVIDVEVLQESGSDQNLIGAENRNYLTIDKIG